MRTWVVALLLAGCGIGCGDTITYGDWGAVEKLSCAREGELGVSWEYEAVWFAAGELYVSCSVATSADESSDSTFHLATEQGAQTGACAVVQDIGATSGGTWTFELSGDEAEAAYADGGEGYGPYQDGFVATFAPEDCERTSY